MTRRFQDGGEGLWTFGDDILVRCPSCAAVAHVIAEGGAPHRARLTCTTCGLARSNDAQPAWPRRCAHCDQWISSTDWTAIRRGARRLHEHSACPRCGRVTHSVVIWTEIGAPEDPFFGEPLALQVPCCGNVLWAWNHRHLALLESLVSAGLRERIPVRSGNSTLLSRLPRWMKVAKHRDAVLGGIARLRRAGTSS